MLGLSPYRGPCCLVVHGALLLFSACWSLTRQVSRFSKLFTYTPHVEKQSQSERQGFKGVEELTNQLSRIHVVPKLEALGAGSGDRCNLAAVQRAGATRTLRETSGTFPEIGDGYVPR